ncbi:MAG: hypothetical protein U9Q29_06655 [Campylobacterota bacterium]|nr:hypothetical protein [Campylobacterota bacterium]
MRSRDGNLTFSLRLCSIIFFTSLALNASEYLISYRYVVKDAILYNETLQISDAMQPCYGKLEQTLVLESDGSSDLKKIISQNSQEFTEFIHKLGLHVKHEGITTNSQNNSTIILTLKTTCFKVDFNDSFANITPLK